ncbi:hypothetical protein DZC30_22845, partial [Comamonas testosteroni]
NTTSSTQTVVRDDDDTSTVTLSSAASVTEGQDIVITATVDKAPQGSNLVLTLSGGHTLTILDGQTSGSVSVPTRADDAYVQGNQTQIFSITAATGGNYENLNTTSSTQTVVQDDHDATTVSISALVTTTHEINVDNVSSANGFKVTAFNANGTQGSVSVIKGTEHDGFGVSGSASGDSSELGYDSVLKSRALLHKCRSQLR